jgi:putative transposase
MSKKQKKYEKTSHATYNCGYHLIWCPKYRRKVLVDEIEKRLKELLIEKALEHKWSIEKMEVMPDHVHVFIKVRTVDSPAHIVSQLKGFTAFSLRKEFPSLRSRLPSMWTRSYFCESVGHISEATIKKYIEEQKNK